MPSSWAYFLLSMLCPLITWGESQCFDLFKKEESYLDLPQFRRSTAMNSMKDLLVMRKDTWIVKSYDGAGTPGRFAEIAKFQVGPFEAIVWSHNHIIGAYQGEANRAYDPVQTEYNHFVSPLKALVDTTFKRRDAMSEAFIKERSEKSFTDYIDHSSFVIIYDRGQAVGGFRLITAPYLRILDKQGQLRLLPYPENGPSQAGEFKWSDFQRPQTQLAAEKFFDTKFERPAYGPYHSHIRIEGETYAANVSFLSELSSLAINRDMHPRLRRHVISGLTFGLSYLSWNAPYRFLPDLNPNTVSYRYTLQAQQQFAATPTIYTYADKVGVRMYRPFGFIEDPTYTKNIEGHGWILLQTNSPSLPTDIAMKHELTSAIGQAWLQQKKNYGLHFDNSHLSQFSLWTKAASIASLNPDKMAQADHHPLHLKRRIDEIASPSGIRGDTELQRQALSKMITDLGLNMGNTPDRSHRIEQSMSAIPIYSPKHMDIVLKQLWEELGPGTENTFINY